MDTEWTLFVEGDSDQVFLQCLLDGLGIVNMDIAIIGGGVSNLAEMATTIQRTSDAGNSICLLLDADSNPKRRRSEFRRSRDELGLPIENDHCFLLPNDCDPGCLETLLEWIAVPDHRVVYECFREYETCLHSYSKSYRLPNPKARIYAYCEALSIEPHHSKRDYSDPLYWDLNASALEPLKQFSSTCRPIDDRTPQSQCTSG